MKKANKNKLFVFITFVILTGLVISGCASFPGSPGGARSTRGGSLSPTRTDSISGAGGTSAKGLKLIWVKSVDFLEKNWISLLIIIVICATGTYLHLYLRRKTKKPGLKKLIISLVPILASLFLIFLVLNSGMLRNDGNFRRFKLEQVFKRSSIQNIGTRRTHAYVNVDRLNFRTGPSTSYRIIRVLTKNTRIEVISSFGTWWKIKYGNVEGYVNSRYLRRE
jgi:hypothetical protein